MNVIVSPHKIGNPNGSHLPLTMKTLVMQLTLKIEIFRTNQAKSLINVSS